MHENGRREMGAPNHLATKNRLTERGASLSTSSTRLVLASAQRRWRSDIQPLCWMSDRHREQV